MRKLIVITIAIFGMLLSSKAQEKGMMLGLNAGILGAGCTNCGLATGLGVSFSYAVMENIAITAEINRYTDSEKTSWGKVKSVVNVYTVAGEYYVNEVYDGFYIGPDISYLSYYVLWDGERVWDPTTNLSVGLNMGYAINIGENIAIVPHLGYGTWFENSKGRITLGARAAYKL